MANQMLDMVAHGEEPIIGWCDPCRVILHYDPYSDSRYSAGAYHIREYSRTQRAWVVREYWSTLAGNVALAGAEPLGHCAVGQHWVRISVQQKEWAWRRHERKICVHCWGPLSAAPVASQRGPRCVHCTRPDVSHVAYGMEFTGEIQPSCAACPLDAYQPFMPTLQ